MVYLLKDVRRKQKGLDLVNFMAGNNHSHFSLLKSFNKVASADANCLMGLAVDGGAADFTYEAKTTAAYRLFVQYAVVEQKALECLAHICYEASLCVNRYLLSSGRSVQDDPGEDIISSATYTKGQISSDLPRNQGSVGALGRKREVEAKGTTLSGK